MRVSVVIPLFQGEPFLGAALDSVLAQDHAAHEVIVVDDGSTDSGAELARARGATVLQQPNRGVAAARNAGVAAASGDAVALLDQDDLWTPDKLARQVSHLHRHPEVGVVCATHETILEPGTEAPAWLPGGWLDGSAHGHLPSTWLIRRDVLTRVGPFDERLVTASDADWLARAARRGVEVAVLPEALLRWRIHGLNASYDRVGMQREGFVVLRRAVAERREPERGR